MKLLIIEDEPKTCGYLRKGLAEHGYVVDTAHDGETGLALARSHDYALIVLDVMLPALDGWGVLRRLRHEGSRTPVLFLTARDSIADRVKGLEGGADDYLLKPFAFVELLARVQSLLRRSPGRERHTEMLRVGDLEIDPARHRAARGGRTLDLTAKEFALLVLLARNAGEAVPRSMIASRVWDMNFEAASNVVDVHVRRLRGKVDDPFGVKLIHTERGRGYVMRGPKENDER